MFDVLSTVAAPSPSVGGAERRRPLFTPRRMMAAILVLALVIRVALLATPRAYFPDEIFQYLEPAHRLVFGPGVVPWEYRYGIRSWLLPLVLAGPMALGGWLDPGSDAYLLLPKLLLVLASLGGIGAAAVIGRRLSPLHGLFAAFVMAIWAEFALFSTQALTEVVAVWIALGAAAILYDRKRRSSGELALAGALVALAMIMRFQYGPAIGVFVLLRCGSDRRCWLWGIAGAMVALAVSSAVDWARGGIPFAWIVENFHQNIGQGRSHSWVDGPFFYAEALFAYWGVCLIPIGLLAGVGARRFPALMAMALTNIAIHSLIAHKEYRYILLSSVVLILLAAIGTIDTIRAHEAKHGKTRLLPIAAAGWVAASILTIATPVSAWQWSAISPKLEAFAYLRHVPKLCGVGLSGFHWTLTGGYTYLHRATPIYVLDSDADLQGGSAGFDALLAPPQARNLPPAFHQDRCFGVGARFPQSAICVYRRAGTCDPRAADATEINRYLRRTDH